MNELINKNQISQSFHKQLLATASALALTAYISSIAIAKAEDAERPTVWIELGGQMEALQGTSTPFTAPFMTALSPTPGPYANNIFTDTQRPSRSAFGLDGKATFHPKDSDWSVSANLRYGRASTNRHLHQQSAPITYVRIGYRHTIHAAAFADAKSSTDESHAILDFAVGKDVGLGAFGQDGASTINVGIRFAQFSSQSQVTARGRPSINLHHLRFRYAYTFYNYTMFAEAARNFHGIGPSLSWNASATLLGNKDDGELTVDWGLNGAVLFGRQKVKLNHTTQAYHLPISNNVQYYSGNYDIYQYTRTYRTSHPHTRSRGVTIPNLGGFAGLSVKYPNAKFSLGYRADFFFGAVDAGIDERHSKNLGFNGPFASISIGLGG